MISAKWSGDWLRYCMGRSRLSWIKLSVNDETPISLCLYRKQTFCALSHEVLAWLSVWSKVQWFAMICIWSSWCQCYLIISCFIKFHTGLTFLVRAYTGCPGKRLLNDLLSIMVDILYHFQDITCSLSWYGDGAGNTTEDKSSAFSLIRMC